MRQLYRIVLVVLLLMAFVDLTSQNPAVLPEGTPEECIDKYVILVHCSFLRCDLVEDYVVCLILALGVDINTYTGEELQHIEARIERILMYYRSPCQIDLVAIIARLRRSTTTPGTTTSASSLVCLTNSSTSCHGKEDGDYPICYPGCERGYYVTCSNGAFYIRPCASAIYGDPSKNKEELMVFDPHLRRCERKSTSCPRKLDSEIFT